MRNSVKRDYLLSIIYYPLSIIRIWQCRTAERTYRYHQKAGYFGVSVLT